MNLKCTEKKNIVAAMGRNPVEATGQHVAML